MIYVFAYYIIAFIIIIFILIYFCNSYIKTEGSFSLYRIYKLALALVHPTYNSLLVDSIISFTASVGIFSSFCLLKVSKMLLLISVIITFDHSRPFDECIVFKVMFASSSFS